MNSDLPTSGDYAWAEARTANQRNANLEVRVSKLEEDLRATMNAVDFLAEKLGIMP